MVEKKEKRYCMCSNVNCCVRNDVDKKFKCERQDEKFPGAYFCNFLMGEEANLYCGDCEDMQSL